MRYESILVLCTGNICRSPMGEVLLDRALAKGGCPARVESAGIGALVDHPADPLAVELMSEQGIDLSGHVARQLTGAMLTDFDLLLVMESGQRRYVEGRWPLARGRVHDIGRWSDFDVPDPYRGTRDDFEVSLRLIERGINDWLGKLVR
ncbi:MAG: low molecular weight protein-tyrosine-phosphatase [Pseudomonadota bacterium]